MVFRFWGDHHADVQQFAPLVDRRAGGIADDVLVEAIRSRGWQVERLHGSLPSLRQRLGDRQPVIVLVEDRPSRFHYVVAVGASDQEVVVHDPTWGPSRRLRVDAFEETWSQAGFWMAVVTPPADGVPTASAAAPATSAVRPQSSACERRLNAALDEIEAQGLTVADRALGEVRASCPGMSAPITELAGVRFTEKRWREAAALANEALRLTPTDRYTWNLLASSLYLRGDVMGALRAWNQIDQPPLDLLRIEGVTRTRYAHVANVLGLAPNTTLTARAYGLAARRLGDLPDRLTSRLSLQPGTDGYVTVTASLREAALRPETLLGWVALGLQTGINREVTTNLPGGMGQGELWSASWRWWENRPRVAASFAAPLAGPLGGVWRVEGSWEAQTYSTPAIGLLRQEQRSARLQWGRWLTPQLRGELRSGVDVWTGNHRAVLIGGSIEQRLMRDRISVGANLDRWTSVNGGASFGSASVSAVARSSTEPVGFVAVAGARFSLASAEAPLSLWYGAGEGRARPGLLRAHLLMHEGIIDGGVFGRRVATANIELQRWFTTPVPALPIAVAVFTDAGHATHRLPGATGDPLSIDSGIGLRAKTPGVDGIARLDYARGLQDGQQRVTVGWTIELR